MSTPPATPTGLTHACARCGAPVPLDVGLCDQCNPLGLRDAASSQVHGTVFLGVAFAVVVLALVARLSVSGIGPFPAQVSAVAEAGDGLAVTLIVTNEGTSIGSTTCRITDPGARYGGASAYVLSPRIQPGETVTFTADVTQLGDTPRLLSVECAAP